MRDAGPGRKPFDWCLQKERKNPVGKPREIEFLDINFAKDESFAQCYSQSLLLADLYCYGFKILSKNRETRKLEAIHEQHFVERKNEDRNPCKTRI